MIKIKIKYRNCRFNRESLKFMKFNHGEKKFDKKPIQKTSRVLNSRCKRTNSSIEQNLNIIHILVDNYYIDEKSFRLYN